MRGRQAGSWAVFHSQNQDPPRFHVLPGFSGPQPRGQPAALAGLRGGGAALLGGGEESQVLCLHGRQPSFSLRPPSSPSLGTGAQTGAWDRPRRTLSFSGDRLVFVPGRQGPEPGWGGRLPTGWAHFSCGPHRPGWHGSKEEGRERSKKTLMPSRTPAAKPSHTSPPGLSLSVCREPQAASLVSPCLHSLPVLEPLGASDLGTRADP